MIGRALLTLTAVLATAATVSAQAVSCVIPPMDQVDPVIRVIVAPAASGGGFDYRYTVTNRPGAPLPLVRFAIEAASTDGSEVAQVGPPAWEARGRLADTAFHGWTTFAEPRGLPAGGTVSGFALINATVPAIVPFIASNDVTPPQFPDDVEPESCEGGDVLENSFKGVTVGPKPPPAGTALDLLDFLVSLVHGSHDQGWIRGDGVHQSLLAKLLAAKRALEEGLTSAARGALGAFLNEVSATSCTELECPGGKPLTSEAYALLFLNGQVVLDRVP